MSFIDFSYIPDIVFAKYGLMLARRFKIWSHKDLVYDKRERFGLRYYDKYGNLIFPK